MNDIDPIYFKTQYTYRAPLRSFCSEKDALKWPANSRSGMKWVLCPHKGDMQTFTECCMVCGENVYSAKDVYILVGTPAPGIQVTPTSYPMTDWLKDRNIKVERIAPKSEMPSPVTKAGPDKSKVTSAQKREVLVNALLRVMEIKGKHAQNLQRVLFATLTDKQLVRIAKKILEADKK